MLPDIPSPQSFAYAQSGSQSMYSMPGLSQLNFSGPVYPSQSFASTSSLTGSDPNSPELFKQNVQLALDYVSNISRLSRNALTGIENAYHSGTNAMQTSADLATLKHNLEALSDFLRQTGVGSLPIVPPYGSAPGTLDEQQVIQDTTKSVQVLYDCRKRVQENNAVVASLLSAAEGAKR